MPICGDIHRPRYAVEKGGSVFMNRSSQLPSKNIYEYPFGIDKIYTHINLDTTHKLCRFTVPIYRFTTLVRELRVVDSFFLKYFRTDEFIYT